MTTLANWYAAGADVAHLLPALSIYLGHVSPATTYWYYSDSRVIPMPLLPVRKRLGALADALR